MKILIIANYISMPDEPGNCRFIYLAKKLCDKHSVEIVTSSFCHVKKQQRDISNTKINNIKITYINEPGYKKNVSINRIFSHKFLSLNLKHYLKEINYKPDVIYCSVPSLNFAEEAIKFAKKNNIRFILDIQDLWPEAFKMAINIPIISDIIFFPMMRKANYIYSNADELVAVSETYLNRALQVNKKSKHNYSVFLGTDLDYFDNCLLKNKIVFNDDYIRIAYVGTLGTSYDLTNVITAIKLLYDKNIKNIKFIVMGSGPLKDKFEKHAMECGISYEFTGRLDYPKMVGLLGSCDICVNPIISTASQSIINKVGDYAAASLPVINTENCQEYKNLLEKYEAGFNCINENPKDISEKIELLINDKKKRASMGKGNRKLAEDYFDRNKTYERIINLIEGK